MLAWKAYLLGTDEREGSPMADLPATKSSDRSEQINTADLAFVAFVIIIAAIAVVLTGAQIYMQNPR
jgi:hypothetical protein